MTRCKNKIKKKRSNEKPDYALHFDPSRSLNFAVKSEEKQNQTQAFRIKSETRMTAILFQHNIQTQISI